MVRHSSSENSCGSTQQPYALRSPASVGQSLAATRASAESAGGDEGGRWKTVAVISFCLSYRAKPIMLAILGHGTPILALETRDRAHRNVRNRL